MRGRVTEKKRIIASGQAFFKKASIQFQVVDRILRSVLIVPLNKFALLINTVNNIHTDTYIHPVNGKKLFTK